VLKKKKKHGQIHIRTRVDWKFPILKAGESIPIKSLRKIRVFLGDDPSLDFGVGGPKRADFSSFISLSDPRTLLKRVFDPTKPTKVMPGVEKLGNYYEVCFLSFVFFAPWALKHISNNRNPCAD